MTDRQVFDLRESSPETFLSLSTLVATQIARLGIASVAPTESGQWRVSGISKVGVVRLSNVELRIRPKVPLARLFYLLGRSREWGQWFNENVHLDSADSLYSTMAEVFATCCEELLKQGALKGYREVQSAESTIRGRWLVSEQIRTRQGLPLPVELQFDEYTVDIPENRLLRSAVRRLVGIGGLPDSVRARLLRIDLELGLAGFLKRGQRLPRVRFDRLNETYRPTIVLAELILTDGSVDGYVGGVSSAGFLIDLPRVFEQFIEAEVTRAFRPFGGSVVPQLSSHLDRDKGVRIKPDLVWQKEGRVQAVFDAKYKAEKSSGYPNADIYQMLAYCIRHAVSVGHLIYAAGNEEPARYIIEQAGVEIVCHAIALDRTPEEISLQIDRIVESSIYVRKRVAPGSGLLLAPFSPVS